MTKRVVLIGHPVAHSLSGAMQQAAFDHAGIDARYELWDRDADRARRRRRGAPHRRLPGRQRHDPPQGAGGPAGRPPDRGGARDRRGQHDHQGGPQARRPQHRRARVQGRARRARRPPEDAAPRDRAGRRRRRAGRRLQPVREGFQRVIVFNRHLHRAESLVKHFSRSAAHMELRAMPWHESIIESELAKTKVLVNATSIGLNDDVSPIPGEILTPDLLVLDLIYKQTRLLRDAGAAGCDHVRRRHDAAPPGRGRVVAVDRAAAPLEVMQAALEDARAKGVTSAEGEGGDARTGRRRGRGLTRAAHGPVPLPDLGGEPRPDAGRHRRGRAGRPRADRGRPRRRPGPAPAGLRPRGAPDDRDRPGRDPGRRPPRADAGLADPARGRQPRLRELDQGHAGRAAVRRGAPRSSRRSPTDGNKRALPITRVRPGHADLAGSLKYGFNDVRNALERSSARETTARVAAGGVARAFLRALGIEVWSFTAEVGGVAIDPAQLHPVAGRGRRVAAALPGPGGGAADDRADRRGAVERRHDRRRVRGRRPRRAHRHRQLRPLGPAAGRRAGAGRDEHPHRQGRGAGAGVRADPAVRVRRPRRDRGAARRRDLGPPHQQRGRADRRDHQRRADRRPRRRQADLHARPAAADRGPRDRRGGREGALRAVRHLRRAGGGRHRRGDGDADAGPVHPREDGRRLDGRGHRQPRAVHARGSRSRRRRRSRATGRAGTGPAAASGGRWVDEVAADASEDS